MSLSGTDNNTKDIVNKLIQLKGQMGDLGLTRVAIDLKDADLSGYSYGSIISDNTDITDGFKVSNPITTTARTAGLTSINGAIDRITFPATDGVGHTLYIASSDANDNSAGTGARAVFVQYLNANWDAMSTTVIMNGQTAVALTPTDIIRVNRMFLSDVGTSQTNEGAITITTVNDFAAGIPQTNIVNSIDNGYSYSAVAIFSTENKQRLYFTRGSYYSTAIASKPMRYTQYSTFPNTSNPDINRSTWYVGDLSISQSVAFNTSGSAPEFPNTDIEFVAQSLSAGTINNNTFWNTMRVISSAF